MSSQLHHIPLLVPELLYHLIPVPNVVSTDEAVSESKYDSNSDHYTYFLARFLREKEKDEYVFSLLYVDCSGYKIPYPEGNEMVFSKTLLGTGFLVKEK